MTDSAHSADDPPLLPKVARYLSREAPPGDRTAWLDFAVGALSVAGMEMNWHYISYLCTHLYMDLRRASGEAQADDTNGLIQMEIANHRISAAIHMQMAVDEASGPIEVMPPLRLPARKWNFPGTDRWVDIAVIRETVSVIHQEGLKIPLRRREAWIEGKLKSRLKALNDRLKDGALWRLQRHAGALNGMQWRRLTKDTMQQTVQVRLHYSTAFLTVSIRVGVISTDHTVVLPKLFLSYVSDEERKYIDSHFGPRALSSSVYQVLLGIRRLTPLEDLLPVLQGFYGHFLAPLFEQPGVAKEIEKLGPLPTLVICTHGVLAQLPFAALHDGESFLLDRFNIVQAPPIYPEVEFGTGDIDFEALVGGYKLSPAARIHVLADESGLAETRAEVAAYRDLQPRKNVTVEFGPAHQNDDWSVEDLRWLLTADVAILSSHVRASALDAGLSTVITPSGHELSFRDILNGDLKTQLVVLAGCDSQGQTDWFGNSEGSVVSLLRRKGAQAVISTLWHVSDLAARQYNEALVEAITDGFSRSQAHGRAQRAVRTAHVGVLHTAEATERRAAQRTVSRVPARYMDHPFYWAPFILSGAWR